MSGKGQLYARKINQGKVFKAGIYEEYKVVFKEYSPKTHKK